eukprot:snap_masked-scaffold_27-processed-gene-4.7-mRNA-1 protein AED:1.00 eAED:1.00 QI:0/0/0/0/1/1/2/0/77
MVHPEAKNLDTSFSKGATGNPSMMGIVFLRIRVDDKLTTDLPFEIITKGIYRDNYFCYASLNFSTFLLKLACYTISD